MKVTNDEGRTFLVRVVHKGEKYGLDDCLTHDEADPLIEFYDQSVNLKSWGPRGQFVSRYYASTLAERSPYGLNLLGYVPEWKIDAAAMEPVRELARSLRK